MTEATTTRVLDQHVLDDLRQMAACAVLDTSWQFTEEGGGLDPEDFATMREQASIYARIRPVGYPQDSTYPYRPRKEDLAILRAAAERELSTRNAEIDGAQFDPHEYEIKRWALGRITAAARVLVHIDALDLENA